MSEDPQQNEEYEGGWDPGPELVSMHYLVAESGDGEGADSDNDNTSRAFDVVVDGLDELSAHDRID